MLQVPNFSIMSLGNARSEEYTSMISVSSTVLFLTRRNGEIYSYNTVTNEKVRLYDFDVNSGGERGLLSLVVHSESSTIFAYLSRPDLKSAIYRGRYTVTSITGMVEIWRGNIDGCGNHIGGRLVINNANELLIGVGDHGCNPGLAQDLNSYYGKILRMNFNGEPIVSNPWFSRGGISRYIYARGFRNPFRMYYQSSSGKLYVNDVGQNTREAIYNVRVGDNYNWPSNDL